MLISVLFIQEAIKGLVSEFKAPKSDEPNSPKDQFQWLYTNGLLAEYEQIVGGPSRHTSLNLREIDGVDSKNDEDEVTLYSTKINKPNKVEIQNPGAFTPNPKIRMLTSWEPTILATINIPMKSQSYETSIRSCNDATPGWSEASRSRADVVSGGNHPPLLLFVSVCYRLLLHESVVACCRSLPHCRGHEPPKEHRDSSAALLRAVIAPPLLHLLPVKRVKRRKEAEDVGRSWNVAVTSRNLPLLRFIAATPPLPL
ncbi:unnamed protein product [Lactuca virosa]|uniref:Uncharacterized protein n=1 Tax=Lactuca virosa TaxID=75947 RepID=A0AAU9LRL0_9ASTR|nr:unnamed protein product [Lactuca virosa]